MPNFLQSEWLKQKHSFDKTLVWLAPLLTVILALVLMGGDNLQNGAYNWWYLLFLPGSFTMITVFTTARERKKNRHGLFGIVVHKNKLWVAQIILDTLLLCITCIIFFLAITIGGILFGETIDIGASLLASSLLILTYAWQIPLWMFITEKREAFVAILLSLLCNFGIAVICAVEKYWWIPFAIPARFMCSILGVLPNGLWVEAGSKLIDRTVILPGVGITIVLYIVLSVVTSVWYEKREV